MQPRAPSVHPCSRAGLAARSPSQRVTPSFVMMGAPNFFSITRIAPLRAERDLYSVSQNVDAPQNRPDVNSHLLQLFCH